MFKKDVLKRGQRLLLVAVMIMALVMQVAYADVQIKLDGKPLAAQSNIKPERVGNTLMLPIRDVAKAMGVSLGYDGKTNAIVVIRDKVEARLALGNTTFTVNKKRLSLDQPAVLKNGRTLVPAHAIEQIFGVSMVLSGNQLTIESNKQAPFRVATLNGPTGVAMAQLIDNSYLGENAKMSYEILANPQLLPAKLIKGEVDIAFMPTNMASVVYNQSKGEVVMVAINTWGLLSVVSTDPQVKTWADLKGKQIDIFGQGSTPEVAFKALLEANGLNPKTDVSYKFSYDSAATLATTIGAGQLKDGIAVIPEPFTSMALAKNPNARVVFSMKDSWQKAFGGQGLPMTAVVVRKAFLREQQALVRSFLRELKVDIASMNANPTAIGILVERLPALNFSKEILAEAIPRSAYRFEVASASKPAVEKYLKVLMDFEPKTIGGKMPGEDFYEDVFTDY